MKATRYPLQPAGAALELNLSSADLGFTPALIWNPSPSRAHRTEPYPVPQALPIGIRVNELTSSKYSPPPIAVGLEGGGRRWFLGVGAEAGAHLWNEATFTASADGVRIVLDLEGVTDPTVIAEKVHALLIPFEVQTPWYELLAAGLAQQYPESRHERPVPDWWLRPIYCGWGDQVAHAMWQEGVGPERRAMAYCIQGLYERWISRFEAEDVPIGTVTIDGGWSLTGVWEPDPIRWPDLRGFIRRQHEAGRKVLLWLGTWLWDGLPEEQLILGDGREWTADPCHPGYREALIRRVTHLLSPEGLDADGFKIDQLSYSPNRNAARWCPRFGFLEVATEPVGEVRRTPGPWGIELLHLYQKTIYDAAKAAKADALITSSTVHPYFHDTYDMTRIHDMGVVPEDLMAAMKARCDLSRAALPGFPIDTDDWVHTNYDIWLDYTRRSPALGVPCLFYTERFISQWRDEPGTVPIRDLGAIAQAWREAGYTVPQPRGAASGPAATGGYQSE